MKYLQGLDFDFVEMLNFEERPFRAKFTPAKIWDDLDKYKNDATGLRNYFKKWRFRISYLHDSKQRRVMVGGGYYTNDEYCELDIWCPADDTFDKFKFTKTSWDRFKFRVIQVSMHELIHFRQYYGKSEFYNASKVYYKKTGIEHIDQNREYHAGRDEIEAYAHCIFMDFKHQRPTVPIATLIRYAKTYKVSKNLNGIQRVFKTDKYNEAVPLLLRKILVWERKYSRWGY